MDADEEARARTTLLVVDAPRVEAMPIPHNAPHARVHSHNLAALGAPDEEEGNLRITSPHRGHAVAMPGRTLLERVRAMGHAIWLPKPPPRGCIARARNPDGPKPDTRTHEGRRHSFDVDVRDHLIVERDAQAASAALLEGGKEDAEQEQRAGCCA